MQKCPLCDKKLRTGDRFCSSCGWDVSDHELTPLQIARAQDEIQHARDGAMVFTIGGIAFVMVFLAHVMLDWYAVAYVIPERAGYLSPMGVVSFLLGLACSVVVLRYRKRETRLRALLRDRLSSE